MRERILEAASELFYAEGFRAVSAEKIIARVGTTKVTFYRHFRSKDDLMVAYLERRAAEERAAIDEVLEAAGGDAQKALARAIDALMAAACQPGYRGCPFINAAAEYADPEHPVRLVVAAHRRWQLQAFERLLASIGVDDPAAAAGELMLLRDGAAVGGYLDDPDAVARALATAGLAIVRARSAAFA
ncbi:TetR/AcrR family transcriptional regulator [Herbiconiux sp. UC225_62]|uniref:TetR/AcrR family transcriptional regulator n=1 Tax=Herbiconiux sp. UC225_62 TaxID=3350168 RepID=UPI0036D29BAA